MAGDLGNLRLNMVLVAVIVVTTMAYILIGNLVVDLICGVCK